MMQEKAGGTARVQILSGEEARSQAAEEGLPRGRDGCFRQQAGRANAALLGSGETVHRSFLIALIFSERISQ